MTQDWIVAVLVGFAALYSLWYVLPDSLRQRLGRLNPALGRAPGCSTACSSCGKCPSAPSGELPPAQPANEQPLTFHRNPAVSSPIPPTDF